MSVAAATARAPDLVDPLIGYRHWWLNGATLRSPFADYLWVRGVNTARCEVGSGHGEPAPGRSCVCGLHAWYRPAPRLGYTTPELVGGAVVMWGDVELHPTGMRAQYAAIVALVLPLTHTRKRRRVIDVARALEVHVVPVRELTATALDHGQPVDAGIAPSMS